MTPPNEPNKKADRAVQMLVKMACEIAYQMAVVKEVVNVWNDVIDTLTPNHFEDKTIKYTPVSKGKEIAILHQNERILP